MSNLSQRYCHKHDKGQTLIIYLPLAVPRSPGVLRDNGKTQADNKELPHVAYIVDPCQLHHQYTDLFVLFRDSAT